MNIPILSLNPQLEPELVKWGFITEYDRQHAIAYLLCLYFHLDQTTHSPAIKRKVHACGIFREVEGKIHWSIPLMIEHQTGDAFDWVVSEYLEIFTPVGTNDQYKRESTKRMKKLFSENPDIRKHEVLGATELMISKTDPRWVRKPHYFISKGSGADRIEDILTWVDNYRKLQDSRTSNDGPVDNRQINIRR